jgi:riboflavin biosynthesis pyrimidine reductase
VKEQAPAERQFQEFSADKTKKASRAKVGRLLSEEEQTGGRGLKPVGNDWTRAHYGGDFYVPQPVDGLPALSLVFVQSADGNTVIENPSELGGGDTDLHLVYEGLSRVACDAVLAGSTTAQGRVFFSVWRPELVALRDQLFLPRHPAQVVVSKDGNVDLDNTLLFNVPDVPVFIIAGKPCRERCIKTLEERPWITVIPMDGNDWTAPLRALHERGINRISVVGGRKTATSLIDAGLVQDLVLTTTSAKAGKPGTPFYGGRRKLELDLVSRRLSAEAGGSDAIKVEQFVVGTKRRSVSSRSAA